MKQDQTVDSARARRTMIDTQIRPNGVTDRRVLAAISAVPREDYLPERLKPLAYRDRSIELGEDGGTALAPTTLAKLLDRARPEPGEKALVVGPFGDYAAALLDHMGLEATTAEGKKAAQGAPDGAPYDLILVGGGVEQLPDALVEQLAPDGRIAAPVIDDGAGRLAIGRKVSGGVSFRSFDDAQPTLLSGFAAARGFRF